MSCCCIFMKVKTIFVFQRNINIKFIGEKSTVFIIEDTGNILFLYNFLKNISFHFMSEWENRFFLIGKEHMICLGKPQENHGKIDDFGWKNMGKW